MQSRVARSNPVSLALSVGAGICLAGAFSHGINAAWSKGLELVDGAIEAHAPKSAVVRHKQQLERIRASIDALMKVLELDGRDSVTLPTANTPDVPMANRVRTIEELNKFYVMTFADLEALDAELTQKGYTTSMSLAMPGSEILQKVEKLAQQIRELEGFTKTSTTAHSTYILSIRQEETQALSAKLQRIETTQVFSSRI